MNSKPIRYETLEPDSTNQLTPTEAEQLFEGFRFRGPGWYLLGTETILVVDPANNNPNSPNNPDPFGLFQPSLWAEVDPATRYTFLIWDRPNAHAMVAHAASLPVRHPNKQQLLTAEAGIQAILDKVDYALEHCQDQLSAQLLNKATTELQMLPSLIQHAVLRYRRETGMSADEREMLLEMLLLGWAHYNKDAVMTPDPDKIEKAARMHALLNKVAKATT